AGLVAGDVRLERHLAEVLPAGGGRAGELERGRVQQPVRGHVADRPRPGERVRDPVEVTVDIHAPVDLHGQRLGCGQAEVVITCRVRPDIAVVGVRAERLRTGTDRAAGVDLAALLEVPDLVGERDVVGVRRVHVTGLRRGGAVLRVVVQRRD